MTSVSHTQMTRQTVCLGTVHGECCQTYIVHPGPVQFLKMNASKQVCEQTLKLKEEGED